MKLAFRLKRICGNVHSSGNLCFTDSQRDTDIINAKGGDQVREVGDSAMLLSPVGNRISIIDLVQQNTRCLPFENRKDIQLVAVSHNGLFVISVDSDGHALLINLPRQAVLARFNFKRPVLSLRFSPDDALFAATHHHGCQIWRTPSLQKEFSPLVLLRTIGGFFDDCTCLDWSCDSRSLIMGSRDLSCRVCYRVQSKRMATSTLSGHRDTVLGVFFSQDGQSAFSVAVDGAVFTWQFQQRERRLLTAAAGVADDDVVADSDSHSSSSDGSDSDSSSSDNNNNSSSSKGVALQQRTKRGSFWQLAAREFLWDPHTTVSCCDFSKRASLLVVGFTSGVFALYEMPGAVNLHRISVSSSRLSAVSISSSGEWLAIGAAQLGQLLVWEWKSESYVLKQQGHLYALNCMDYSSDGQFIATGGDDGKVKIWNNSSGFCFVTFAEHTAAVTGVRFVGKSLGKSLLSASFDGTVRAHDLLRYRCFRTLTAPLPVQFTSLAADSSGEVVCAGTMDPFHIYVWSLQTGKLLDVLAGHEGPIACLAFAQETSLLASGSWDGTLKLWDIYKSTCVETAEHGCDVLAVAFRPDGREVCCATTSGCLSFWDTDSGASSAALIEGRRDISGGRLSTDAVTADNSARSKYFTSVCYTADGSCVLAGGLSKYVCIYVVATGALIKKFQLSHNRSLEGVLDELRSDRLVNGIALDNLFTNSSNSSGFQAQKNQLPAAASTNSNSSSSSRNRSNDGSRTVRPEVISAEVQFSPSGRDWAVVSTQGLQVFSLDDNALFAPSDLDVSITPQAVQQAVDREEFARAVNIALHLGERYALKGAVDAVPAAAVELVVRSLDMRLAKTLLNFIAEEIIASRHVEFYLQWCWSLLSTYSAVLSAAMSAMSLQECIRALIRAVALHEREVMRRSDENHFTLQFLRSQMQLLLDNSSNSSGSSVGNSVVIDSADVKDSIAIADDESTVIGVDAVNHSLATAVASAVEATDAAASAETPQSSKKKKKSASKRNKEQVSLLEQQSSVAAIAEDEDEDAEVVAAAAFSNKKRRVSFSQPLTHEKIISPLQQETDSDSSDGDATSNSGSAVKKKLWTSVTPKKPLKGRKKWLKDKASVADEDNGSGISVPMTPAAEKQQHQSSNKKKKAKLSG